MKKRGIYFDRYCRLPINIQSTISYCISFIGKNNNMVYNGGYSNIIDNYFKLYNHINFNKILNNSEIEISILEEVVTYIATGKEPVNIKINKSI